MAPIFNHIDIISWKGTTRMGKLMRIGKNIIGWEKDILTPGAFAKNTNKSKVMYEYASQPTQFPV
jgi:hypothetical protein